MPQRSIRFSEKILKETEATARARGFSSATGFIRYAVEQELAARQEGLTGAEERLAGSVEQVRRELFRLGRAQQALFAYLDTLANTLLTCVPEPPADAKAQAVARARERHDRLLKTVGRSMLGDSTAAMQDLVSHGPE
jgi:hypothetical protein